MDHLRKLGNVFALLYWAMEDGLKQWFPDFGISYIGEVKIQQ